MNASQKKIIQLESTIHALEELLTVSESSFLKESKNLEEVNEKLEESIQRHEKLESDIEQILDSSSDAIRVIDKDYNIIYTSKSFNLLHGHPEDIIGKKCYDVVPEDECHTKDCSLKRILKSGKRFTIERTLETQDGTKKLYNVDIIPYKDSQGEFLGIIKNYRDITEERQAEARLAGEIREREMLVEKYRILFETSGDAIMLFNDKGFFDCNKATLELFGFPSKKQFIKIHPGDISPVKQPDGRDSFNAANKHIEKAFREGTVFFEWLHKRQDGTLFPAEVLLSRMEYQDDIVVQATVRDISERKQAEERLVEEIREREKLTEKYRILFEISGDAIMLNNKKGYFDCNQATLELFGFSREEFLKLGPVDITTAKQANGQDSSIAAREHVEKAIREGTDFFEWNGIRKDGSIFPCEVMLSRMKYQGNTVFLAVVRNITERKQAEAKLAELSEEYRILFESSADAIMLHAQEKLIDCNNASLKLFGFSSKEEFAKVSPGILSPAKQPDGRDSLKTSIENMEKACREGTNFFEWFFLRQDGTIFPAEVLLSRVEYQGNIMLQATIRDITERKYAEQQKVEAQRVAEENAQQKGRIEMANNMLHDIGNAMTGISTYVLKPQMEKVWQEIQSLYQLRDLFTGSENELIKVFGKEKQHALNDFMKALISSFEGRHAKHLEFSEKISSAVGHVCSVLDLQRHYLGEKASPLATKINLPTIISDTLVMLSGSLKKRNIEVSLDVKDKNLNISGDQTRLMRVFLNIIKNTCEAFDETGAIDDGRKLEITIALHKNKEILKAVFSDNGIGFAAETGEELFERGFTSKINGSGIGLHECRSIIESHGGTITMESNGINTGALTIITFPIFK